MPRPPKMRWAGRRTKSWMASRSARLLRPATHARRTHAKLSLGQACVSASSFSPDTDTCVPTRIAIDFCGREQNPAASHPVSLPANPDAAPAGSLATGGAPRCERRIRPRAAPRQAAVRATDGRLRDRRHTVTGGDRRHTARYGQPIPSPASARAGGHPLRAADSASSGVRCRRRRAPNRDQASITVGVPEEATTLGKRTGTLKTAQHAERRL